MTVPRYRYDVFCRMRDDEGKHVDSMRACQDPDVRSRARIVELGAIVTAAAIFTSSMLTVETLEYEAPIAARAAVSIERQVVQEIEEVEKAVTGEIGEVEKGIKEKGIAAEFSEVEREIQAEIKKEVKVAKQEEADFASNVRNVLRGRPSL